MSNESEASFLELITDYRRLLSQRLTAPEARGTSVTTTFPERDPSRPCGLILSPHPDDECLTGALPLRLRREKNWQIVNVAVTLGSNPSRQKERQSELAHASAVLGITSMLAEPNGFLEVTPQTRESAQESAQESDRAPWKKRIAKIQALIEHFQPTALFMPHAEDGHPTHKGTHLLGIDALAKMPKAFSCSIVLTEYWTEMTTPNALVGIGEKDAATLVAALSCHRGEVERNAYDRRFPAYLIDAVRRGEKVAGQGKDVPEMDFATLYQLGKWVGGRYVPSALSRFIKAGDDLDELGL